MRIRRAFRRGRGDVFDLLMGGRVKALNPSFRGDFSAKPFQQTKAVVENGSKIPAFPLPMHLCALCVLCGSPPHPDPQTFLGGSIGFPNGL
jgi:hypothetical protein